MKLENLHSAVKNVQSNLHQLKKQQQKQQTISTATTKQKIKKKK